MSEHLRLQYVQYLDRYKLKPRRVPPLAVREASLRKLVRIQYEEAVSRDDPMAESILETYEINRERYVAETRHTATMIVEAIAAEVEANIRAIPVFAQRFRDEVFVGEFPTGSINAEAVKVDGGYLVLVNSGVLSALQQAVGFLCRGDADHPGTEKNAEAEAGVAAVLRAFIKYKDPFYGPAPVNGGARGLLSSLLSQAAKKFVIAHEYGHILAGHFERAETVTLETSVGPIEAFRKQRDDEFEADEIGYRLTLGVGSYTDFDLARIDAGTGSTDIKAIHAAASLKALIAGPFVPLVLDVIIARYEEGERAIKGKEADSLTHPRSDDRIEKLLKLQPGRDPHHSGFINIPFLLLPAVDRIAGSLLKEFHLKEAPPGSGELDNEFNEDEEEREEELLAAVGAVHRGDHRQAALLVTDAFEKQRTVFEPDCDVVVRELVRAMLGRPTDIRRTLLDRHNHRRAIEQKTEAAQSDPLIQWAMQRQVVPPARPDRALYMLQAEPPAALEMTLAAVKKARANVPERPESELLPATVAIWRNDRAEGVAAFEAALSEGIPDTGARLAQYLTLEKRALTLLVRLDIQEMLALVARQALGEAGEAAKTASLVRDYVAYLDIPLGPMAQNLIDRQLAAGSRES